MNRRGFLASLLAVGIAPGVVRAGSLMPSARRSLVLPLMQVWGVVMENKGDHHHQLAYPRVGVYGGEA